MIFISDYKLKSVNKGYPFIPLICNTEKFVFDNSITVVCGDNGCGKSTFAKIIAAVCKCVRVSYEKYAEPCFADSVDCFSVAKKFIPKRSFYFSAEEFIQFVRDVEERKQDALQAIEEINANETMSDYAKTLARQPHADTLMGFENFYGVDLAEVSHGQGFLTFFEKRLRPDGFYIIDEPEAALSSENQFLLASKIKNAAETMRCQFVVCTHSPIIAATPNAALYEIENDQFVKTEWEQLADVVFLQMFLKNRGRLF